MARAQRWTEDRAQGSGRLVMGKGLGGRTSLRSTLTSEPSSPTMPESFNKPPSRLYWAFPDVTGNPPPRPLLKPHGGAPVPDTARKHSVPTGVSSLHFSCNTACLRRKIFKGNYLYGLATCWYYLPSPAGSEMLLANWSCRQILLLCSTAVGTSSRGNYGYADSRASTLSQQARWRHDLAVCTNERKDTLIELAQK